MNYTWYIAKLGLKDELNHEGTLLENSVVEIQWKRVARDTDGTEASYVGRTKLSARDVDEADFTQIASVTKEQAIQWVENNMSDYELNLINKTLERKVERNRQRQVSPSWI
jgi:hypothetical protein